MSSYKQLS